MSIFDDLMHAMRPMALPANHLSMQVDLYRARKAVLEAQRLLASTDCKHLSVGSQERVEGLSVMALELSQEITKLSDRAEEEMK